MDFSTEFVALRDKLLNGQDPHFRSQQNVQVSGRMAALLSVFNSRTPRKILGLMPTGGTSHAHEYRLLFAVPSLDEQTLDDWWKYAQQVSAELVKPDENHDFSLLSVRRALKRPRDLYEKSSGIGMYGVCSSFGMQRCRWGKGVADGGSP